MRRGNVSERPASHAQMQQTSDEDAERTSSRARAMKSHDNLRVHEPTETAPKRPVQRVDIWPTWSMWWCIAFAVFDAICLATGNGTPTIQAFALGWNLAFAIVFFFERQRPDIKQISN